MTTKEPEVARLRPRLDLFWDLVLLDLDRDRRDECVELLLVERQEIPHFVVERVHQRVHVRRRVPDRSSQPSHRWPKGARRMGFRGPSPKREA